MTPKPNEVITIENDDGILHEMTVNSVDESEKTVTGKITFRITPESEVTEIHTIPMHRISWVGHRKLQ